MNRCLVVLLTSALCASLQAQSSSSLLPQLTGHGSTKQLVVDGKPFLILGGELLNSSSSSLDYMRPTWPRLAAIPLNTVLTPISWELVEPREGEFSFSLVDGLIDEARQNKLHLVFLWLASWKNGMSSYAPAWVKKDSLRFPRVVGKDASAVEILSPLSENAMQADARAFAAVMRHIRDIDGGAHTVLMIQVENEVGVLGDSRDHSEAANHAFGGQVPRQLTSYLKEHHDSLIPEFRQTWDAAGAKLVGTWAEMFGSGVETDKIFMSWNYARYIQQVAAAGKGQYPIPMYANTWLAGSHSVPGEYPSGGPLPEVIDIWKAAGSALDFYSPDIYAPNFAEWCDRYSRQGNTLFIPEARGGATGGAQAFLAIGGHQAIGFSPFGIDSFVDKERPSELDPDNDLGKSYKALMNLAPMILEHQGKGEMAGFLLDAEHPQTTAELGGYQLDIRLDRAFEADAKSGFGLVMAVGPDEFVGAGTGFCVSFRLRPEGQLHVGISSIDEGTFSGGAWVPGRRLNGDESEQGKCWRFIPKRIHIEKAVLYRYQ